MPRTNEFVWGQADTMWGEEDVVWGQHGYPDIDKPKSYTNSNNYLLINATDYLLINGSGDKLIISVDQNSIYTQVIKPT